MSHSSLPEEGPDRVIPFGHSLRALGHASATLRRMIPSAAYPVASLNRVLRIQSRFRYLVKRPDPTVDDSPGGVFARLGKGGGSNPFNVRT